MGIRAWVGVVHGREDESNYKVTFWTYIVL